MQMLFYILILIAIVFLALVSPKGNQGFYIWIDLGDKLVCLRDKNDSE